MVGYWDLNDTYLHGGHPSHALPAVLAMSEALGASGRDTLMAAVVAYESFSALTDAELALAQIAAPGAPAPVPHASFGRIVFDRAGGKLRGPAGTVALTPSEGVILGALLDAAGEVVRLETLAHTLWGRTFVDGRMQASIRSHVHTLRARLRSAGLDRAVVVVRGIGYRLTESGGG